jgi:hypothetical protein
MGFQTSFFIEQQIKTATRTQKPSHYICLLNSVIMNEDFVKRIAKEVEEIKTSGLYKIERIISSSQGAEITVNNKNRFKLLRQQLSRVILASESDRGGA